MNIEQRDDMVDGNCLTQAEAGLPGRWYYDDDHYRRELDAIWYRNWVYVCRTSAIAEPLAFQTLQLDSQNIVVVRAGDGSLQAYHNTCRHRGSVLCDAASGRLGSRLIVCPYHQWAYAADDGRLVKTSSFSEPEGFSKNDYGLDKVAVAEWRGCVLVNLDAAAVFDETTDIELPPEVLTGFHWPRWWSAKPGARNCSATGNRSGKTSMNACTVPTSTLN
jgi:Rieske 2Fe-2S family protein